MELFLSKLFSFSKIDAIYSDIDKENKIGIHCCTLLIIKRSQLFPRKICILTKDQTNKIIRRRRRRSIYEIAIF